MGGGFSSGHRWGILGGHRGLPTRKRLEEVGLKEVADNLAEKGRLAEQECPAIEELLTGAL